MQLTGYEMIAGAPDARLHIIGLGQICRLINADTTGCLGFLETIPRAVNYDRNTTDAEALGDLLWAENEYCWEVIGQTWIRMPFVYQWILMVGSAASQPGSAARFKLVCQLAVFMNTESPLFSIIFGTSYGFRRSSETMKSSPRSRQNYKHTVHENRLPIEAGPLRTKRL
ncbi:uncharacterized protein BDZ99DRAFT_564793 [Mytilinidion resinicola]|uniref:Uncharacterized protein n=1 Tax=Mytilinidion resinicola TaxID=574789 RepID=A0A6A6Z9U0_9PEZI|nr:uncharacterized protein BDZ99DRAFT_564793 [Mytilinidion resinicola]KAF2816977.1 hypothetical protein BDZ99DRAFT_564793 [Mytilinidion resinicola]